MLVPGIDCGGRAYRVSWTSELIVPLTMRPTGGHSPVYADRQDWTIFDDGKPVGSNL